MREVGGAGSTSRTSLLDNRVDYTQMVGCRCIHVHMNVIGAQWVRVRVRVRNTVFEKPELPGVEAQKILFYTLKIRKPLN